LERKKVSFLNFKGIPPQVFILGLVSFLTDFSSDMVYPLLPVFLIQYLGAGQGFVGLIEGFAESTAAFFTLVSGFLADRARDRSKLVLGGYSLSSLARPLIALAWHPWAVFCIRFMDRVGKGIRTSPRDALIADQVEPSVRGKAYGLHRSMDHAGAIVGPLAATLILAYGTKDLRHLFLLAGIPGALAVLLILWKVREVLPVERPLKTVQRQPLRVPKGKLRTYLIIVFLFVLSCSSDAFLLLRVSQLGVSKVQLPLIWMVFNMVKMSATMPLGALSDKLGRRHVILFGWIVYTLVYLGFGMANAPWHAWVLFISYGLFYGFTEGSERALLADYAPQGERGQAFGWYYFLIGLGSLPASLLFGWIWQIYGSGRAFFISAGISACAAFALFVFLSVVPTVKPTPAITPLPEAEKD